MMKDDTGDKIIDEFVGLRAKLCSYNMHEGKEEKKCKGTKKNAIKIKLHMRTIKTVSLMQKLS